MRKIFSVMLMLTLLLSGFAYAEDVNPSPTIKLVGLLGGTGVTLDEGFVIRVEEQQSEEVKALFDDMFNYAKSEHIISYFAFDEEAENALQELLPEDVDLSSLQMDEFFEIESFGYDPAYGDVEALFDFMTDYPDDANLLAVVGIIEGDTVTWIPLKAEPEGNLVKVTFTQAVLEKLQEQEAVLALLRAA